MSQALVIPVIPHVHWSFNELYVTMIWEYIIWSYRLNHYQEHHPLFIAYGTPTLQVSQQQGNTWPVLYQIVDSYDKIPIGPEQDLRSIIVYLHADLHVMSPSTSQLLIFWCDLET